MPGDPWQPPQNWNPIANVGAKETALTNLRTALGPNSMQNPEQIWNLLAAGNAAFQPRDLADYYYICWHIAAHQ
jgi:hypothetical protein